MSTDSQSQGQARPSPAEAAEASILDQAIKATKATEASAARICSARSPRKRSRERSPGTRT